MDYKGSIINNIAYSTIDRRSRRERAANASRRLYPDAVGEVLFKEFHSYSNLNWLTEPTMEKAIDQVLEEDEERRKATWTNAEEKEVYRMQAEHPTEGTVSGTALCKPPSGGSEPT